jgi:spore germination cell wall hydrolase CwlJ-like protein
MPTFREPLPWVRLEVQMRVFPDYNWGAANIYAEARGEPWAGQVAVGNVVRNRMRRRYSSDGTVVGTIFRPHQFSWTRDVQLERVLQLDDSDPHWDQARAAWQASESEHVVPAETVLYHADYVHPTWASAPSVREVKRIGRHIFYEELR